MGPEERDRDTVDKAETLGLFDKFPVFGRERPIGNGLLPGHHMADGHDVIGYRIGLHDIRIEIGGDDLGRVAEMEDRGAL